MLTIFIFNCIHFTTDAPKPLVHVIVFYCLAEESLFLKEKSPNPDIATYILVDALLLLLL